ncbi:polysaccharide pyruvyl transferase family protein [Brevundimonas sp. 2R-24]|uniref:Polysaccharide pyruvyl transferase family protein n=1 Tax=Peiella sedimenti TaxID=3061083 RepID=A0ABT8SKC1_9CAUL|nr:polysaccharide pyruvyl transferase family protein [Caulobacteraceae bacterium XZ-24]
MPASFGLITFPRSENAGDAIQSLAALRFLPRVDFLLDRESLDVPWGGAPGSVKVVGNGWYAHDPERWPPAPEIELLPISMHFSPRALDGFFSEKNRDWWRSLPHKVGARDLFTLEAVQARGVEAYFSGCLTLTLTAKTAGLASGRIILCDVSEAVRRHVERKSGLPVEVITHAQSSRTEITTKLADAERLLATYAGAAAVVTTRIHAALPCLALGTPVFLINDAEDNYRFSGLADFLHYGSEAELLSGAAKFSLNGETENSTHHLAVRGELERATSNFISGAPKPMTSKKTPGNKAAAMRAPSGSGSEADFGRTKDGDPGAPHHVPAVSSNAVTSPDAVLLAEIARLRAEQGSRDRELESLRARLKADEDALIGARTEAARLQARYEVLQETQAERAARLAELEALRPALLDAEARIRIKDDYIGQLERARDQVASELARAREAVDKDSDVWIEDVRRLEQARDEALAELEKARRSQGDDVAELERARDALNAALAARDQEIRRLEQARDQALAELEQAREAVVKATSGLPAEALAAGGARAASLAKARDQALADLSAAEKARDEALAELERAAEAHAGVLSGKDAYIAELERARDNLGNEVAVIRKEQRAAVEARNELAGRIDEKDAYIAELERARDHLASEVARVRKEQRTAEDECSKLVAQLEDAAEQMTVLEGQISELARRDGVGATNRSDIERIAERLAALEEQAAALEALDRALKAMADLHDAPDGDGSLERLERLVEELRTGTGSDIAAELRAAEMRAAGAMAENLTLRDNIWRKDNQIAGLTSRLEEVEREAAAAAAALDVRLEEAQRAFDVRLETAERDTARATAALQAELRTIRMKYVGAAAENLTLRDSVWRKDLLLEELQRKPPSLVRRVYLRLRPFIPRPILFRAAHLYHRLRNQRSA